MTTHGDNFFFRLFINRRAAAFILASAMAGCGGGQAVAPPAATPLAEFTATAEFEVLWSGGGGGGDFYLRPAMAGDSVCAAGANGELRRWRIDDGETLSQTQASGAGVAAAVGCDEEFFAVADANSVLRVIGGDGEIWSQQLRGSALGAPLISQARLFVLGGDGGLAAYPLRRSEPLWRWRGGDAPPLRIRADSRPVFADGVVYAGLAEGRIAAVRADTGAQVWNEILAEPGGNNPIAAIVEVTTPVIVGETVCAGAYQGRIGCLVRDSGQAVWRREFSSLHSIAADGERLFARSADGALSAFDARGGDILWTQNALQHRGGGAPAAIGGFVAAGDGEGYLHAFQAANGAPAARLRLDGSAVIALLAIDDSRLIAQTASGGVFALSLR